MRPAHVQTGPCRRSSNRLAVVAPRRPQSSSLRMSPCVAVAEQVVEAGSEDNRKSKINTDRNVVAPPALMTPEWQKAVDLQGSGELFTGKIKWANFSGVTVQFEQRLKAFIPYKLIDRRRIQQARAQENWEGPAAPPNGYQSMCGQDITLKVIQVIVPERRLICSEKAAQLDKLAASLVPGDVIRGRVSTVHPFGAFIEVEYPETGAGAEVMVPLREISWEWIPTPSAALSKGQEVMCKVMSVSPPPKQKIVCSLKRMQQDPLQENLDSMLPLEGLTLGSFDDMDSVPTDMPSGVEDIISGLLTEQGVVAVNVGRRLEERRTVSQDLELWLTKETVVDGFNLVARAGRVVQEIHVVSSMSRQEMKEAVQRVLKRVT